MAPGDPCSAAGRDTLRGRHRTRGPDPHDGVGIKERSEESDESAATEGGTVGVGAIEEGGQEEMQEALQLAASLMITHVTLNDVGTYYIVTELESCALLCARIKKSHQRQKAAGSRQLFLFFPPDGSGLQTPWQQQVMQCARKE